MKRLFLMTCLAALPGYIFCQMSAAPGGDTTVVLAAPKAEFRAAWVASVENIDWPSKKGLTTDMQKDEFIRLLEMHKRNGLNAVIVQIRPAADAMYPSPYEPWSEWLTGVQGKAPSPYYDPLQFMIEETHKRGMEFHAWCNPYRAVFSIARSSISPTHITRLHPEWFLNYGGTMYFDPGNKEVQKYVTEVIRDIVRRYDIDALHFDDYFYPYRIAGKEFPDYNSYMKYGNGLSHEDWRRSNTDSIIVMLGNMIHQEKKYVKFGISPFCVWRNNSKDPEGSETQAGQTNYDDLYADILLWLKNGWIDYVAPQLYLEIGYKRADFPVLLDWWSKHTYGRQCYIGLAIYRAGTNLAWRDPTQLTRQLRLMRANDGVDGAIYFSSKSFERNPLGWNDSLRQTFYNYPALIPPMPWIDSTMPKEPYVHNEYDKKDGAQVAWLAKGSTEDTLRGYAIYRSDTEAFDRSKSRVYAFIPYDPVAGYRIRPTAVSDGFSRRYYYFATAVSRTNVESEAVPIRIILSTFENHSTE
jgi:uncharacterized lipoprotein YddW (UPF0748 family)